MLVCVAQQRRQTNCRADVPATSRVVASSQHLKHTRYCVWRCTRLLVAPFMPPVAPASLAGSFAGNSVTIGANNLTAAQRGVWEKIIFLPDTDAEGCSRRHIFRGNVWAELASC